MEDTKKKVILLGDSIRKIGYGEMTAGLLERDGYEVWQPEENCRYAQFTERLIYDNREIIKGADIVHWNNGHWDHRFMEDMQCFTSPEFYVETMIRIAKTLKVYCKRVIFATTTPLHADDAYRKNELVRKYNALVVPELIKLGVEINDLYAFVEPHKEIYIRTDDLIHLTEEGIRACSEEIAAFIEK